MNFQELMQRIAELDQPIIEEPNEGNAFTGALDAAKDAGKDEFEVDGKTFKVKEDGVEECGMSPMSQPRQQDNVSMNVNMTGSGAGGIRDLLDILKNLDSTDHSQNGDLGDLIDKMDEPEMPKRPVIVGNTIPVEEFANEPDEMYAPIGAVTPTGNDIHSKGAESPAVAGGGNPWNVREEALIARLSSLYEDIKGR